MMKKSKEHIQDTYEHTAENVNTAQAEKSEEKQKEINQQETQTGTDKTAELSAKIANYEVELKEIRDAYLRKAAEFENYKRRSENEQSILLKYAAEPFIRNMLQVYDDLDRSLNHASEENQQSLIDGLKLVYDKFTKILDNQGVTKMDAKGKPFDVQFHEALMSQPAEGVPDHTVLNVVENGYLYKDKVIRHAKVIVSQAIEENGSENN
jgi:molecular chaperone GrpE